MALRPGMMTQLFALFVPILLFVLPGCARGTGSAGGIALRLQLPATLRKDSTRYRRFLSRVDNLEITATANGTTSRSRFAPNQWENLPLLTLPEGEEAKGGVDIEARVWDRRRDGHLRGYPILVGHKHVSAKELASDRQVEAVVRLSLMEGAAAEFD